MLSPGAKLPALLVLSEDRNATPRLPRSNGLFHFALRYSGREDLARAYRRLVDADYPVDGASDHGVSEAIYLSDPEGNGVELYADRPRAQWRRDHGQVAMVTEPLALEDLLSTTTEEPKAGDALRPDLGHIHLHVADLGASERFYTEFLGLAVTQRSYPGALFFAAGGYHHHIGVNVWGRRVASPPNSVGLLSYRFEVPVQEVLYCLSRRAPLFGYETRAELDDSKDRIVQIRDPNGQWLEVQAAQEGVMADPGSSLNQFPIRAEPGD